MSKKSVVVKTEKQETVSPVAMLVQIASQFESEIYIEDGSKRFNAKSIMGMMTLGLAEGKKLLVTANGTDEADAINSIAEYLCA